MKFILTLTLSILISACVSTPSANRSPGLHTIAKGSILRLNQPLTIPAGKLRISVQFGEATVYANQDEPYCEFLVNTFAKTATTLPFGDYRITRILRYEDPFLGTRPNSKKMVASSSESAEWVTQAMSPDFSWKYLTVFRLESDVHPDIRQVECGSIFYSGYEARHITIKEFEILAGDVMTLQTVGK